MSKKQSNKKSPNVQRPAAAAPTIKSEQSNPSPRSQGRPMLRAVKVTPELLGAAREYKKATKISFYQLGEEAITERLQREGYLPRAGAAASNPKTDERRAE